MHDKIAMLARTNLNSIESKISEALINSEISHENFTTINDEKNYCELKGSDTEKNYLIEEGKRKGIDAIIRQNA